LPSWAEYTERADHARLVGVYNSASVYLCASEREGFGNTVLEAMASGCAVVTTDAGGSRQFAKPGISAVVADRDPDALAAAVESLLIDDARRAAIVDGGLRCAAEFTWTRTADLLERAILDYVADPERFSRTAV
jgi:glycosyltransferase involved in cell wall biosynthesis